MLVALLFATALCPGEVLAATSERMSAREAIEAVRQETGDDRPADAFETWLLPPGFPELRRQARLVTRHIPKSPESWQRFWVLRLHRAETTVISFADPTRGALQALTALRGRMPFDAARQAALAAVMMHLGPDLISWELAFANTPQALDRFVADIRSRGFTIEVSGHVPGTPATNRATWIYRFSLDEAGAIVDLAATYRGPHFE